jgi:hypothetical protein
MLLSYGTSRKTRSFFYLGQAKHGKKRFKKNSISQIKERSVFDMMANNCVVWGHTPPLALGSVCSTPPPPFIDIGWQKQKLPLTQRDVKNNRLPGQTGLGFTSAATSRSSKGPCCPDKSTCSSGPCGVHVDTFRVQYRPF